MKNLPVVQDVHEVLATQVSHKHPVMSNNLVHVKTKWTKGFCNKINVLFKCFTSNHKTERIMTVLESHHFTLSP